MTTITGIIRDSEQNALAGAIVTLRPSKAVVGYDGGAIARRTHVFTADGSGSVTMTDIAPGGYAVTFSVTANDSTSQTVLLETTGVATTAATMTLETFLAENALPVNTTILQQAEAARDAAILAQTGAETAETNAEGHEAGALAAKTAAELAALAAGAPIVTSLTAPTPANGTIELLKLDAGLQVWEVQSSTWTLLGWLVGPTFDTVADLLASTATTLGPTGQIIYAGGFRYEVVTTGEHVTTAGGVKLVVLVVLGVFDVEAFGAVGDGVADDSAALVAAASAIPAGRALRISKNYLVPAGSPTIDFANDGVCITGGGTISAGNSDTVDVVTLSGANIVWDRPTVEGTAGWYTGGDTPSSEADRHALILVNNDNITLRSGGVKNPWMCGVRGFGLASPIIESGFRLIGGTATKVGQYGQLVRLINCDDPLILWPSIKSDSTRKTEHGVFLNGGSGGFVSVVCEDAWEHPVYAINQAGLTVADCDTISGSSGIAVSPAEWRVDNTRPTIVRNNRCRPNAAPTSDIGIFLRDVMNMVVAGNHSEGWPFSYGMQRNQYSNADNEMARVVFAGNHALGWTKGGLTIATTGGAATIKKVRQITIDGFVSTASGSGISATAGEGYHIVASFAAGIVDEIIVSAPVLTGGKGLGYLVEVSRLQVLNQQSKNTSSVGWYASGCDDLKMHGGTILNTGTLGVDLAGTCVLPEIVGVRIQDAPATGGTTDGSTAVITGLSDTSRFQAGQAVIVSAGFAATSQTISSVDSETQITVGNNSNAAVSGTVEVSSMLYGIDGNNNVDRARIENNTILGMNTVPLRRCQNSGHKNQLRGNRTGDDSLTGIATLSAAVRSTINNDNINTGVGYTSYVRLAPINTAAGTLISGANSPIVQVADYVNAASFDIRTAGAGSAAGTEEFFYEIVQ